MLISPAAAPDISISRSPCAWIGTRGSTIYGEFGSVVGKTYNPWYFKGSDVECFSERDGAYHRLLGADAHFYRLQLEGFAEVILDGARMQGADGRGWSRGRSSTGCDRAID